MFTIITTDQSGGIYNSYNTGGQGFINEPCPQATPLDSACLLDVACIHMHTVSIDYCLGENVAIAIPCEFTIFIDKP